MADLAALREEHTAFVTGAQIVHETEGPLFAFSRIDRDERIEYVVVTNNATLEVPARFTVLSADTTFTGLRSADPVTAAVGHGGGVLSTSRRSRRWCCGRKRALDCRDPPEITLVPEGTEIPTFRYRLEAALADRRYAEVTFAVSVDGGEPVVVGTDDAAPYRVYWDNSDVPTGATVDVIATVDDGSGRLRSAVRQVTIGERS